MAQGAVVYEIKNNITGQVYIGVTVDFERRKLEHFNLSHWTKTPKKLLYRSMAEYGYRNFTMTVVREFSDYQEAVDFEIAMIDRNSSSEDLAHTLNVGVGGETLRDPVAVYAAKLSPSSMAVPQEITRFSSQNQAAKYFGLRGSSISVALKSETYRVRNIIIAKEKTIVAKLLETENFVAEREDARGAVRVVEKNDTEIRSRRLFEVEGYLKNLKSNSMQVRKIADELNIPRRSFLRMKAD